MSGSHGIGSKPTSNSTTQETIQNMDERMAVQGGFALNDSSFRGSVNINSTDAVQAIAGMGIGSVVAAGGAVTDLTGWAIDRNVSALENLTNRSTELVDSIIDRTYGYSREAQEQATFAITQANQSAIAQINAANSLAAGQVKAANDAAAGQVKGANEAAARVTGDALAGARAVIGQQSDQIAALSKSTQALGASLSQAAVAAYQPGENKALDSIKTMGIAAAVVAGLFFLLRAAK